LNKALCRCGEADRRPAASRDLKLFEVLLIALTGGRAAKHDARRFGARRPLAIRLL
jgi:hypothetical protein